MSGNECDGYSDDHGDGHAFAAGDVMAAMLLLGAGSTIARAAAAFS